MGPNEQDNLSAPTSLEGVLERITFYNEENGFLIGKLKGSEEKTEIAVVGKAPKVQCGETLVLSWLLDHAPKAWQTILFDTFESKLPASAYGIRKYLASGLIHGIGRLMPKKSSIISVLIHCVSSQKNLPDFEKSMGSGRCGQKASNRLGKSKRQYVEVMMFLQTYGVTDSLCLRLVRKYGNEAKTILETDPYRIIREVKGIGFKTADRVALNLGLASNGPPRIDAGILHTLQECEDQGHTHFERRDIALHAIELLQAESSEVEKRIDALLNQGEIVETKSDWIQLPTTARAEISLAQSLNFFYSKGNLAFRLLSLKKQLNGLKQKPVLLLLMLKRMQ